MFGLTGVKTGYFRETGSDEIRDDELIVKFLDNPWPASIVFKIQTLIQLEFFERALSNPKFKDSKARKYDLHDFSLSDVQLAVSLFVDYASLYDVLDTESLADPYLYERVERIVPLSPSKGNRFLALFERCTLPNMSYSQASFMLRRPHNVDNPPIAILHARKIIVRALSFSEFNEGEEVCKRLHLLARNLFWKMSQVFALNDKDCEDPIEKEFQAIQKITLSKESAETVRRIDNLSSQNTSWIMRNWYLARNIDFLAPDWLFNEQRKAMMRFSTYTSDVRFALNMAGIKYIRNDLFQDFCSLISYYGFEFGESEEFPFYHPVANDNFLYELTDLSPWHLEQRIRGDLDKSYQAKGEDLPKPIIKNRLVTRVCDDKADKLKKSIQYLLDDWENQPRLKKYEMAEKLIQHNRWDECGISPIHLFIEKVLPLNEDHILFGEATLRMPNLDPIPIEINFTYFEILVKDGKGLGSYLETVELLRSCKDELT